MSRDDDDSLPEHRRRRFMKAASLLAMGTLAGCSGDGDSTETTESSGSDSTETQENASETEMEQQLVTHQRAGVGESEFDYWSNPFWSASEEETADNPDAAAAMRARRTAWAEENSDFQANFVYQSNYDQWEQNLLLQAGSGEAPGGSIFDAQWYGQNGEFLQSLNEYVDDIDDFLPFVQDVCVQDGELVGTWFMSGCRVMYYRGDLIDEPPRTWDDVISIGSQLSEEEDITGFAYLAPFALDTLPLYWGQDADLVDDDGAPVLDENRDAVANVFNFVQRTAESGVTPQRFSSVDSYSQLGQEGANGEVAMFIGATFQYSQSIEPNDDNSDRWEVAHIPMSQEDQFATGVGGFGEAAYAPEATSASEEEAEAAAKLAAKAADPELMGEYCRAGKEIPTRESVLNDTELWGEDVFEFQDEFVEIIQDGVARPGVEIYPTIADEWTSAMTGVLSGETDPETAADNLIENVGNAYDG